MQRRITESYLLLLLCLCACSLKGQSSKGSLSSLLSPLFSGNTETVETYWQRLVEEQRVPLVVNDSVAFLYKGEAKSVQWMGDFNGWGYQKKFNNTGVRIKNTNIWYLLASFPANSRLDYKIVVDQSKSILDPVNTLQQWSGVGGGSPNSELRMPQWKMDSIRIPNPKIKKGNLKRDLLVSSKTLGYQITYSVYTPADFDRNKTYPVVYVTDGYEYLHEELGNMISVLDNLMSQKKIKPIIAVFVDHREPINRSNNRRMEELAMNERYLTFFTSELIPSVEAAYPIKNNREQRAILGTSMGGLTAAYFSFSKPDVFGLAGIQSPAFWFKPEIYTHCDNTAKPPVKIFLTTGTINDAQEGAEKMKSILSKNTCTFEYKEVPQGHSWGNWKDLIDDILIYFFAAE